MCAAGALFLVVHLASALFAGNVPVASSASRPVAAFGLYDGTTTKPDALDADFDGNVKYAMDFQDGTSWSTITQSGYPYSSWRGTGYSMVWGIPMLPNSYSPNPSLSDPDGSCYGLTQEANGAFDAAFTKVAEALDASGFGASVIRLGWEFNLNWVPWSADGCATAFVGAYRQIVTSMQLVPGVDFKFEWSPSLGDQGVGNLADYYPGRAFVKYVGLDVYDVGWGTYRGAQAEFDMLRTRAYGLDWLSSFAASVQKPIVLPEWGLGWGACDGGLAVVAPGEETCGGDDATFVNDMAAWIRANNVVEDTFWDYGTSTLAGCPNACTPIGPSAGDANTIANGNIKSFDALVADFGRTSSTRSAARSG